ncbi:hypothetical protein BC834DRAFT_844903 [Gloeopeniophorella convolvens]|nr:hypothetical protein BC834DRAFT_844903 [Gloeopeniophorella convolvens]
MATPCHTPPTLFPHAPRSFSATTPLCSMDTSMPRLGTNAASSTTDAGAEVKEPAEVAEMGEAEPAGASTGITELPAPPSAASQTVMFHVVPEHEVAKQPSIPADLILWRLKCAPSALAYAGSAIKVYLSEDSPGAVIEETFIGTLEFYRAICNGWVSYVFVGQDAKAPLDSEQTLALITCPQSWAFPPGSFDPLCIDSAAMPRADSVPARYPSWAKDDDVAHRKGCPCEHIVAEDEEAAAVNMISLACVHP